MHIWPIWGGDVRCSTVGGGLFCIHEERHGKTRDITTTAYIFVGCPNKVLLECCANNWNIGSGESVP